jgi:membrane peptidoglycan carboxypeptidase
VRLPVSRFGKIGSLVIALAACGVLVAGFAVPVVLGVGLATRSAADKFLDTTCDVTVTPAGQTTTLLASDGTTVLASLFSQNRRNVALTQIAEVTKHALLATEDRRFYQENGVDLRSLLRAAISDSAGDSTQGGSTLTMQYIKQVRFFQAKTVAEQQAAVAQTADRKIADAKCALDFEKTHSKDQILTDYFNIAYFGEHAYGIEVAARTYFGVTAAQLTVAQSALLVGLLQSPSDYDPFVHPDVARQRRNEVLQNMVEAGYLTGAQAQTYQQQPLGLASSSPPTVAEGWANANAAVANAGFFCDYAVSWLENQGGLSADVLQTGGLRIVTTLDAALQNSGQQAVWSSGLAKNSPTALVMPSIDPPTGGVTTMITSRVYGLNAAAGQTTVPLFTTGYAGAGSTYKYFTALAALKAGVTPNYTLTTGNAYTVRNCPTDEDTVPYTTHNAGTYAATLPLRIALPESVNTYFVGLEDQLFGCDLTPVVDMALSLGMTGLNAPESAGGSTTIAQAVVQQHQTGFTLGFSPTAPLQLAGAYAMVANDGVYCAPTPIKSITGPDGVSVPFTQSKCTRIVDSQTARTMVNMMTADTDSSYGTAGSYFGGWYADGGSPVAAKTGTDNDATDSGNSALWFVGVTPTLVSAAALVNPSSPNSTVSGLPEQVENNGSDVFGAYAATFWLAAYQTTLATQQWTWPQVSDIEGAINVPNVTGQTQSDAAANLAEAGFPTTVSTTACRSSVTTGNVAYYEPQTALPGTTVSLCVSAGDP